MTNLVRASQSNSNGCARTHGGPYRVSVALKIHVEPVPAGMWADGNRVGAFEEMYRRCHRPLVELCRRHLCGRGDAEAVAQEAFVRAWLSLDKFSGARPFWPWVATIARRLCIDTRRRLEREMSSLHVEATAWDNPPLSPDEVLEAGEERASARMALEQLKPSERRVITLRDVNGWSYDEIARFEGVTVESIRGSLKRAREALRRSYARVAGDSHHDQVRSQASVCVTTSLVGRRVGAGVPSLPTRVSK